MRIEKQTFLDCFPEEEAENDSSNSDWDFDPELETNDATTKVSDEMEKASILMLFKTSG